MRIVPVVGIEVTVVQVFCGDNPFDFSGDRTLETSELLVTLFVNDYITEDNIRRMVWVIKDVLPDDISND